MTMSDFEREFINQVLEHFSGRICTPVIKEYSEYPYLQLCVQFGLYEYCTINAQVWGEKVSFSWCSAGYRFVLVSCNLLAGKTVGLKTRLGTTALEELDSEIRLRIPDKYLIAKGWA
jgi:hypothetical protein